MFDIEGGGGGGNSSLVVVFGLFFLSISICVLFFSFFVLMYQQGALVLVHRHWRIGPLLYKGSAT